MGTAKRLFFACLVASGGCSALQVRPTCGAPQSRLRPSAPEDVDGVQSRRDLLAKTVGVAAAVGGMALSAPVPVRAAGDDDDDNDLTSKLFNEDGSLKEGVESEAKERTVSLRWKNSADPKVALDTVSQTEGTEGSDLSLSYKLPAKWSDGNDGDDLYFDRSEGTNAKACKRITVYQPQGKADLSTLQKASTVGVAKALQAPDFLQRLYTADIISGRTDKRDGQLYYEFDMAAAPESCGKSKENLGLGFCPYDNIFLLSATVLDDKLYVACVECDSTRIWKLASAELKRVRSSFSVTAG